MPFWHLRNSLCYNSRLTEHEFKCVLTDYCRGISASASSKEFKETLGKIISRQTIADYFRRISKILITERKTYPWFSMEDLECEITEEQQQEIRNLVYGSDFTRKLKNEIMQSSGKSMWPDAAPHIAVLREMSKSMNGLPKQHFFTCLIRACEIALHREAAGENGVHWMYTYVKDLFEWHGHYVFERKRSPTTRAEHKKYLQWRRETEDERLTAPFEPDPGQVEMLAWLQGLTPYQRRKLYADKHLTAFADSVELPPQAGVWFRQRTPSPESIDEMLEMAKKLARKPNE